MQVSEDGHKDWPKRDVANVNNIHYSCSVSLSI